MSGNQPEKTLKNPYKPAKRLQSANTDIVDDSAARLWAIERRINKKSEIPTKEELEGSGAEAAVLELAVFALSRPIPIHFDENLQPTTETNRCLTASVLTGYVGKYLKYLRGIDPNHPEWKGMRDNEFPKWWTRMRESIETNANNNQIKWQGSYEFGAADIRPLYLDLGAKEGEHNLKFCDLKHIVISLVERATPHNKNIEMAAKIVMTYDSVARGGEAKFQKYTDWSFDYMTYVLDTKWNETKTCDKYAMPRLADERWWFCFFFVMGAFAMCEGGLFRDENDIKAGLEHAVFPSLYRVADNYVTTQMGNEIKKALPAAVQAVEDMKKMFSAKSLRIGAVNELALHAMITIFHACARTGHSTGTTIDHYLDRMNPILGLPAAHALHGKKNIHAKKAVIPKISAVGDANKESIERLIDKMFVVSIPEFQKGGILRTVLEIFAASLILHYPQVVKDCGPTNRIASVLEDRALEAKITYAGRDNLRPLEVLKLYSADIKRVFDEDTKSLELSTEAKEKGSLELIGISQIAEDVTEIKRNEKSLADQLAATKLELERMTQENERLKEELARKEKLLEKANQKLSFVQSNSSPVLERDSKRQRLASDLGVNLGVAMESTVQKLHAAPSTSTGEVAPSASTEEVASSASTEKVTTAPSSVDGELRNTNELESFNSSTGDSGKTLKTVLTHLAKKKFFHPGKRLDSIEIPKSIMENRSKLKHCLTLVDFAGDPADIKKLCRPKKGEEQNDEVVGIAVGRLVKAATDKMFEFEGTTAEIEFKAKGGNTPGTSVLGLARRVMDYRTKIRDELGLGKDLNPSQVELIEYEEFMRRKKEKEAPAARTALDKFLGRGSNNNK